MRLGERVGPTGGIRAEARVGPEGRGRPEPGGRVDRVDLDVGKGGARARAVAELETGERERLPVEDRRQLRLDGGATLSIAWQVLPYALLTFGEVLVSATGLEFAYSQAPAKLKSVLMSFFNLSVTVGNLWVLLVNASVKSEAIFSWTSMRLTAVQRCPEFL